MHEFQLMNCRQPFLSMTARPKLRGLAVGGVGKHKFLMLRVFACRRAGLVQLSNAPVLVMAAHASLNVLECEALK